MLHAQGAAGDRGAAPAGAVAQRLQGDQGAVAVGGGAPSLCAGRLACVCASILAWVVPQAVRSHSGPLLCPPGPQKKNRKCEDLRLELDAQRRAASAMAGKSHRAWGVAAPATSRHVGRLLHPPPACRPTSPRSLPPPPHRNASLNPTPPHPAVTLDRQKTKVSAAAAAAAAKSAEAKDPVGGTKMENAEAKLQTEEDKVTRE